MALKKLAERWLILKPLLNFTFVAGVVFIVFLFLYSSIENQNNYALPSLLLAAWSLLLSAIIGLLANTPGTENIRNGWFSRLKFRIAKGLFTLAVAVFILLSFALLYATIKLLSV
ncbi:MAG: hypothetical protein ACPG52_01100 [Cognaticolwellia sp.]